MNTNKKIAVVVMVLTVILAVFLYGTEYSSSADPEQLADTLTEYIFGDDIKVQVVQTKRIDNYMMVLFTDTRYDNFLGLARLKGGAKSTLASNCGQLRKWHWRQQGFPLYYWPGKICSNLRR